MTCAFCGSSGGFVAGPDHATSCPRFKKAARRVLTIRAPKPRTCKECGQVLGGSSRTLHARPCGSPEVVR